jgi:glycosyltransferase involved in cell wall biosynthesis
MKERIEFAGEIKDRELLNKEYEKAKVFILPSRFEGFPLVLPEAMKNGCYLILSSKIPPAEELTDNGKYGLIVEPDNIEQLSETIAELCSSDKNWNDTALEIIDKATENYDWINICNKLDKELKSICKESRTL